MNAIGELLRHFQQDRAELVRRGYLGSDHAAVTASEFALSDPHNGGKRVCRLRLSDGTSVIYKPRELASEAWVNEELLSQLPRDKRVGIGHRTLLRRGYGWSEDVLQNRSSKAVEDLWLEAARAAALLCQLNATDMHTENALLLTSGVHLVDLETIAAPNFLPAHPNQPPAFNALTSGMFEQDIEASLSTLTGSCQMEYPPVNNKPHYYFRSSVACGVELVVHKGRETARARIVAGKVTEQSTDAFAAEFTTASDAFVSSLRKVVPGRLRQFKSRFVPRPTVFYGRILQRLYHPRMLEDGAFASIELADLATLIPSDRRLARCWAAVVNDEFVQLARGDIPYFSYRWNCRDLCSTTAPPIRRFFSSTGLSQLLKRLSPADERQRVGQIALIRASLQLSRATRQKAIGRVAYPTRRPRGEPELQPLTMLLTEWSTRICESAGVAASKPTQWMTPGVGASHGDWIVEVGDRGFYAGYWGIVLGLEAVTQALRSVGAELPRLDGFLQHEAADSVNWTELDVLTFGSGGSGLAGYGGTLRSWSLLHRLDPRKWKHLESGIHALVCKTIGSTRADVRNESDVITGSSGVVLVAIDMHRNGSIDSDALSRFLRRWEARVREQWEGEPHKVRSSRQKTLPGFAHGRAGLLSALLAASNYWLCSGNDKRAAALTQLATQIRARDDAARSRTSNWLEGRQLGDLSPLMNRSWCHGTTGMAMSRIDGMRSNGGEGFEQDLARAMRRMRSAKASQDSDIYCCGECGEIDLLADYGRAQVCQRTRHMAELRAADLAQRLLDRGQFFGPLGSTSPELAPGLFQGASGVLYTFSRLLCARLPRLVPHAT